MNKHDALNIIIAAAKSFDEQFCGKNMLIVYNNAINPYFCEIKAISTNFLHLTGVELNKDHLLKDIEDKKANIKEMFYQKCINNKISESDFEFKADGTTVKKLQVLLASLNLSSNARMIGDYYEKSNSKLKDFVAIGGIGSFIGFFKQGNYYRPYTTIKGNLKDYAPSSLRVLAILSKGIDEPSYSEIKYVAKKIDIDRLLKTIKSNVSISSDLLSNNEPSISTPPNINLFSANLRGSSDGAAVLSPPRQTLGQAVLSVLGSIKQFFDDRNTRNARMIKDLKGSIEEQNKQLAAKDNEISSLKKECADLSDQLEKQKQLVTTAAKSTGSFSQNLDDFAKRVRAENAAKPQSKTDQMHKTDKKR